MVTQHVVVTMHRKSQHQPILMPSAKSFCDIMLGRYSMTGQIGRKPGEL